MMIKKSIYFVFLLISIFFAIEPMIQVARGVYQQEINKLQDLANKEDVNAMIELAKLYLDGIYVNKDVHKAIELYEKAIEKKDTGAMIKLAKLYLDGIYVDKLDGIYVDKDVHKAIELYEKAIEKKDPGAMIKLAKLYLDGIYVNKDVHKAIELYEKAANKSNLKAIMTLAKLYLDGEHVKKDVNKAIKLYNKAIIYKGDSNAMVTLAKLYLDGEYVNKDINKAIELYKNAVKKENLLAMKTLAKLYLDGEYVNKDINKAIELYEKAVKKKSPYAMNILAELYLDGEYVDKDINKAIELYKNAANRRNTKAMTRLGNLYLHEEYGVPQDIKQATFFFQEAIKSIDQHLKEEKLDENQKKTLELDKAAIEQGLKEAIAKGYPSNTPGSSINQPIFQWVRGLKISFQEDLALARLGDGQKAFQVGLCYHFGIGTLPDSNLTIDWLEYANHKGQEQAGLLINLIRSIDNNRCNLSEAIHFALEGDPIFSFSVAQRYHYGLGIQFDLAQAGFWYQQAKAQGHIFAQKQLELLEEKGGLQLDPNLLKALHFFHSYSSLDLESLELLYSIPPIQPSKLATDRKLLLQRLFPQSPSFFTPSLSVCSSEWEGVKTVRKRAYQGDREAWYQLGEWYYNGDHANNLDRAMIYWNRASEMGHPGAMLRIGEFYWTRRDGGIQSNLKIAVHYFQQAIIGQINPNPVTLNYLARAYLRGRGIAQNIATGIRFLHQAAHQNYYLAQVQLREMNRGANIIQRVWRRYQTRQENQELSLLSNYIKDMATRIQRVWRRHYLRIHCHH